VKYEPTRTWDGTNYFGASLLALTNLSQKKGYSLVHVESNGVNAFFVRDDCLGNLEALSAAEAYQTPKYGGNNGGHAESSEKMIAV
jgi:glycine cleavage system H lipoate-binding protein